jgi:DNA-3-methyladenine glycosylase
VKLPRSFYLRSALHVAPDLLGRILVKRSTRLLLRGRIVEVEAYLPGDPASHAFRGRTARNDVMFWEGGHLYVYFTYGMHFCANVVTGSEGKGSAVLIRAVEPLEGIDLMRRNRSRGDLPARDLCNGPAKLCQAFGIGRTENGTDLCGPAIWIDEGDPPARHLIARSSRIGIRTGTEHRWRFYIKDSHFITPGKPSR